MEFVRLELNLANPLTKPLNKKLVEETSRGMRLMSNIEVNSDGNPTYQNGGLMKQDHIGNNKSLVDCEMFYQFYVFESSSLYCK